MIWQDTIFMIGGIVFAVALFPQAYDVYHGKSINIYSSIVTGLVLGSYVLAYYSLGLVYAAETTLATAALWIYIGIGSWYNGKTTHN